jgi:hypothetical protein
MTANGTAHMGYPRTVGEPEDASGMELYGMVADEKRLSKGCKHLSSSEAILKESPSKH